MKFSCSDELVLRFFQTNVACICFPVSFGFTFFEVKQEIMYCFRSNPSVKQAGNEMMSFENGKRTALTIVVNGVKK